MIAEQRTFDDPFGERVRAGRSALDCGDYIGALVERRAVALQLPPATSQRITCVVVGKIVSSTCRFKVSPCATGQNRVE